jgi:hypothetical protein
VASDANVKGPLKLSSVATCERISPAANCARFEFDIGKESHWPAYLPACAAVRPRMFCRPALLPFT